MLNLFLIAIAFIPSFVFANAKVVYLREPVSFELPMATKNKIVKGSILPVGTRIRVAEAGLVVFKGDDGSVVKLEGGAAIELTKIGALKSKGETLYTLVKGSAFFDFPKNKDRKAGVRTKTASLGVRGTQFFVAHAKENDVWMCVNEGLVAVTTTTNKNEVKVKAGEGVKLSAGKTISNPKALPWTKKLNWKMDPSKGKLDNTVSIEEAYASPINIDID